MSCNTCGKSFSLFRKEKGCPACGYSYCSKCLNYKVFVDKIKSEAPVCVKCHNAKSKGSTVVEPPDAYYKLKNGQNGSLKKDCNKNAVDQQIADRLNKLKKEPSDMSEDSISKRLQNLREIPTTSDAELQERLAKLRGVPISTTKTAILAPVQKTEQEQVDDLLLRFKEQTQIDSDYQENFGKIVNDMESRLMNLKGASSKPTAITQATVSTEEKSLDEEEAVIEIVEKLKQESLLEDASDVLRELPFCEICNEDATVRCLGCKYLFCKRCFHEHKDDDDGCNRYEPYSPNILK